MKEVHKVYKINQQFFPCRIVYRSKSLLHLRVKNKEIYVSVPPRTAMTQIDNFVLKNANYITEKMQIENNKVIHHQQKMIIMDREYEIQFSDKKKKIGTMIYVKEGTYDEILDQIMELFKKELLEYLIDKTKLCYQRFQTNIPCPEIKLRKMKRFIGDYSKKKNLIKYTTFLIFRPVVSYEAVICHELAHMIELNHSPRFYQLVYQVCPNYKQLDRLLKQKWY